MSHTVVVMGSVIGDWESVLLTLGLDKEAVALYEFLLTSEHVAQARQASSHEQQQATQAARALAMATNVTVEAHASLLFLRTQLQRLRALVSGEDLQAECDALLLDLQESPAALAEHLRSYQLLVEKAAREQSSPDVDMLLLAMAEVREEIESPLFAQTEFAALKAQLLAQLAGLEGMTGRQRKTAEQGLALLRQRIHREVIAQVEREANRKREAEVIRARISVTLPRLQSISQQQLLPEFASEAMRFLAELGTRMGGESARIFPLLDEADALFSAAQQRLRDRFTASYLHRQVTDVLQTMGYAVTQIPSESQDTPASLVTRVEGEIGLEVGFDNAGGITTELVSLADEPLMVDDAQQEKVCALVDRILETLQRRNCAIRERFRSYADEDEQLRTVEIDSEEAAAMYQSLLSRVHEEVEIDTYE